MPEAGACILFWTAEQALRGIPAARPQVALMDLSLPGHSGIDCARRLKVLVPELPIVMFTARSDSDGILLAIQAGACGYLIKPAEPRNFFSAVTRAAEGRLALCEQAERVLIHWLGRLAINSQLKALTPREREILPSILAGLDDKQISERFPFPINTVHGHRTNLYKKFGAHCREEFIEKFLGPGRSPFR